MTERVRAGLRLVVSNGKRVAQPVTRAQPPTTDKWVLVWARIDNLKALGRGRK